MIEKMLLWFGVFTLPSILSTALGFKAVWLPDPKEDRGNES